MSGAVTSLRNVIAGFFIGMASQVPGVSGGTLAVIFGVYDRLIRDLDKLSKSIRKDLLFLVTLGVGIVLGMWLPSNAIVWLTDNMYLFAMFLFIGLIIGQLPDVTTEAVRGRESFNLKDVLLLAVGFAVAASAVFLGGSGTNLEHNYINLILVFACGILLAISKLMPGISGSTLLLMLGLYENFYITIFATMDFFFLIPLGLGLLIGILGFSKVIRYLLDNHRSGMYMVVLGLTLGSVVTIYPGISGIGDLGVGIAGLAIGVLVSLSISFLAKKIIPPEQEAVI